MRENAPSYSGTRSWRPVILGTRLIIIMHAGNLEDKGKISLLHEQWGKYEVYVPSENKRIRGDLTWYYWYKQNIVTQHKVVLTSICIVMQRGIFTLTETGVLGDISTPHPTTFPSPIWHITIKIVWWERQTNNMTAAKLFVLLVETFIMNTHCFPLLHQTHNTAIYFWHLQLTCNVWVGWM